MDRQTDTCENITFPRPLDAVGNNHFIIDQIFIIFCHFNQLGKQFTNNDNTNNSFSTEISWPIYSRTTLYSVVLLLV